MVGGRSYIVYRSIMIDAASTQINLMGYDRSDDLLRSGMMGWYLFTAICLMDTTDPLLPSELGPATPVSHRN